MAERVSPIANRLTPMRGSVSPYSFLGRPAAADDTQTVNALRANQSALENVSSQLTLISAQINGFTNSLNRISTQIAESSVIERLKENQENTQQRILAEQKLREGKESAVEKKVQNSLIRPVQKVGAKTQSVLGNLMNFFTILLGGWLLNSGIQALKARSEGNKKRLQEIGKDIATKLGIAGAIFGTIKLGFDKILGSLTRSVGNVSRAVFLGLFKRPVQALIDAVKGAFKKNPPPTKKPPKPTPTETSKPSGAKLNFTSNIAMGTLMTGFDIAGGEEPGRAVAGAAAGMVGSAAAFGLGSLIPLPGTGVIAGAAAYSPAASFGKGLYDTAKSSLSQFNSNVDIGNSFNDTAKSFLSQFNFNVDIGKSFNDITNMIGMGGDKDKTQEQHTSDIIAKSEAQVSPPPPATDVSRAQVSPPPPATDISSNIGPEPEQKTRIVFTDASTSQSTQMLPTAAGKGNSLPTIMSSNPDNFYTLYSQIHYNVVV